MRKPTFPFPLRRMKAPQRQPRNVSGPEVAVQGGQDGYA